MDCMQQMDFLPVSCISHRNLMTVGIYLHMLNVGWAYTSLRNLWYRRHIRLSMTDQVYTPAMLMILVYASEVWWLRTENVGRLRLRADVFIMLVEYDGRITPINQRLCIRHLYFGLMRPDYVRKQNRLV